MLLACCSASLVSSASGNERQSASSPSAQFCSTSACNPFRQTKHLNLKDSKVQCNGQRVVTCQTQFAFIPSQNMHHNGARKREGFFAPSPEHPGTCSAYVRSLKISCPSVAQVANIYSLQLAQMLPLLPGHAFVPHVVEVSLLLQYSSTAKCSGFLSELRMHVSRGVHVYLPGLAHWGGRLRAVSLILRLVRVSACLLEAYVCIARETDGFSVSCLADASHSIKWLLC